MSALSDRFTGTGECGRQADQVQQMPASVCGTGKRSQRGSEPRPSVASSRGSGSISSFGSGPPRLTGGFYPCDRTGVRPSPQAALRR